MTKRPNELLRPIILDYVYNLCLIASSLILCLLTSIYALYNLTRDWATKWPRGGAPSFMNSKVGGIPNTAFFWGDDSRNNVFGLKDHKEYYSKLIPAKHGISKNQWRSPSVE